MSGFTPMSWDAGVPGDGFLPAAERSRGCARRLYHDVCVGRVALTKPTGERHHGCMTPPSDGTVRVLIDDQEIVLDDVDAVVALVREGKVVASTQVSLPGSPVWQTADSIPEVAAHIQQDPWAAWDDLEAVSEDAGTGPAAPEGGTPSAPEGVEDEQTAPTARPLEELPVDAVRSMAPSRDGRMVVETPRRSRPASARSGKVIAFPGNSGGPAAAVASLPSHALTEVRPEPVPTPLPAMELPADLPAAARAPAARTGGTRWWRVALIGGAAVTIMLTVQWYITSTATAVFPPAVRTPPPAEPLAAPPATPPAAAAAVTGPAVAPSTPAARIPTYPGASGLHDALEADLRAQMPDAPRDISQPGQLEDALLIELTRMRVPTSSIRAPVLTWAGRKNDVPQSAEIHIRYRSAPGELERELGAVGLVVGRYVHTYALEVPALDVVIERQGVEPRQLAIDPSVAQRFYLKRLALNDFLDALR